MGGPNYRVTGEGDLLIHKEDIQSSWLSATFSIMKKDSLAVVKLARDQLLLCLGEVIATDRYNSQRVALIALGSENLNVVVRQICPFQLLKGTCIISRESMWPGGHAGLVTLSIKHCTPIQE